MPGRRGEGKRALADSLKNLLNSECAFTSTSVVVSYRLERRMASFCAKAQQSDVLPAACGSMQRGCV
jgi:hypothetical protein